MRLPITAFAICLSAGCGSPDLVPAWGFDPITLVPALNGGVEGTIAWHVYGQRWERKQSGKHLVCGAVVSFRGEAIAPESCTGCTAAWTFEPTLVESDCDEALLSDPLFLSLRRVGLTSEPSPGEELPYPGLTVDGMVDYGAGWEQHGVAFPAGLDYGENASPGGWDGTQTFTLWPTAAWTLGG